MNEENCCEHCTGVAPENKRFCSLNCERCEHKSVSKSGCDNICLKSEVLCPKCNMPEDCHSTAFGGYPAGYFVFIDGLGNVTHKEAIDLYVAGLQK